MTVLQKYDDIQLIFCTAQMLPVATTIKPVMSRRLILIILPCLLATSHDAIDFSQCSLTFMFSDHAPAPTIPRHAGGVFSARLPEARTFRVLIVTIP